VNIHICNISRTVLVILFAFFVPASLLIQTEEGVARSLHSSNYSSNYSTAQNPKYQFVFREEPLSSALKLLSGETGSDVLFDSEVTAGMVIHKKIEGNSTTELLRQMLVGYPLDFIILSSGTYVIIQSAKLSEKQTAYHGRIIDAVTGEPLYGAAILLASAEPTKTSGSALTPNTRGTITTKTGHFSFPVLTPGPQTTIISHIGYETRTKIIRSSKNQEIFSTIELYPKPVQTAPVIVTDHKPIRVSHQPVQSLSESIEKWEGGQNSVSPLQQLQLFGGIQSGLSLSDVHIQGSPRGGHRVFLDDIPVYNPYTLGTVMGAFSSMAIGDISMAKAGFKASEGSYTAGKIKLGHDLGNRNKSTLSSYADFLHTHAVLHQSGTFRDDRFRVMIGYRSKTWDLHRGNGISDMINDWSVLDSFSYQVLMGERIGVNRFQQSQALSDASYSDFHAAASWQFDAFRTLRFSLYRGNNAVMTDLLTRDETLRSPSYMFTSDKYNWRNDVSSLQYDWIVSDRLDISMKAGYSSNRFGHTYSMADNTQIQTLASGTEEDIFYQLQAQTLDGNMRMDGNNIHHLLASWDLHWYAAGNLTVRSGMQLDHVESDVQMEDLFFAPIVHEQKTNLLSQYGEVSWMTTPSLHVMMGYRISGFLNSETIYLEPRFSVQYDHETRRGRLLSMKLAGGKYYQFINQFEITNAGPNNIVPFITVWSHDAGVVQPKAYHLSLSTLVQPASGIDVQFDLFAKLQPVSYITSYMMLTGMEAAESDAGFDSFSKETEFRSLGGSIRIRQALWDDRAEILAGYDLEITRVDMESQFGRSLPAPWSQPHRLQLRALTRIGQSLTVIGKWSAVLGRTWAYRELYYNYLAMDPLVKRIDMLDFENPDQDRLDPFYRLDVSIAYQPTILKGMFQLRADLMNVLNRRNVLDRTVLIQQDLTFAPLNRTLPGFTPSLSVGIRF